MQPGKPQSLKRRRPHVPLEQRKRTVQACVQCRISKRKCRPGPRDQCANCARSRQACVFESVPAGKHEIRPHESPKGTNRPKSSSRLIPWAVTSKDISVRFNEICPENALEPDHFSILSSLFREAVCASQQRLDVDDSASYLESTSSRLTASPVGRQNPLHVELLVDLASRKRCFDLPNKVSDCIVRDNRPRLCLTEEHTSSAR